MRTKKFKLFYSYRDEYAYPHQKWTKWEEVDYSQYGYTIKEWKDSCKSWLDMGAKYRYKIVKVTEEIFWTLKFKTEKTSY